MEKELKLREKHIPLPLAAVFLTLASTVIRRNNILCFLNGAFESMAINGLKSATERNDRLQLQRLL